MQTVSPGNYMSDDNQPLFPSGVKFGGKEARKLYKKGKGFQPYDGKWWVGKSGATSGALRGMEKMAGKRHKLGDLSKDMALDLMKGKHDPSTRKYDRLYDQAGNYGSRARDRYKGLLGETSNQAFQANVDAQAGKLGDDISRQFGGSSFGSAAHSGTMVDQIGDFRNKMASDNWHQNNAMQRGLLGDLAGVDQTLMAQRQGLSRDLTGVEQMGVQNRMAGLNAAPGVYDFQYAPDERMAQVGAAREGYRAAKKQGKMDKHDARQRAPWDRLGAYMSGVGGGGYNATYESNVSAPGNPWGQRGGGGQDFGAFFRQMTGG